MMYCKWCGEPVELSDQKLFAWQHVDENQTECTQAEPAPAGAAVPFIGVQKQVMQGSRCVAVACSHTFAKRIARALNNHKPNTRGY